MTTYEKSLEKLTDIIARLEEGNLTLDESMKLFESGMKNIGFCHKKLEDIKKRIELLVDNGRGEQDREPFEPEL